MFSKRVTEELEKNENIEIIREEVTTLPEDGIVIIATGPLTSDGFVGEISKLTGNDKLYLEDIVKRISDKYGVEIKKGEGIL